MQQKKRMLSYLAMNDSNLSINDEIKSFSVNADESGLRLDQFCAARLHQTHSRAMVKKAIEAGDVAVNQKNYKPKQTVLIGDQVTIRIAAPTQTEFEAEPLTIDVVYEDAHIIVIDKRAGLTVHPGAGLDSGTLMNGILYHYPDNAPIARAGIVHRLDKDTSGLMVIARSDAARIRLSNAIADRKVTRLYLALAPVHKALLDYQSLDWPIGRDQRNRTRMQAYDHPKNTFSENTHLRSARTDVYRINQSGQVALLLCKLHSGRTHQIRVHMKKFGSPLLGDTTYGGLSAQKLLQSSFSHLSSDAEGAMWIRSFKRQALHAVALAFTHPITERSMQFFVPPPTDLQHLLSHTVEPLSHPRTFAELLQIVDQ